MRKKEILEHLRKAELKYHSRYQSQTVKSGGENPQDEINATFEKATADAYAAVIFLIELGATGQL